jgi:hypothetical protein
MSKTPSRRTVTTVATGTLAAAAVAGAVLATSLGGGSGSAAAHAPTHARVHHADAAKVVTLSSAKSRSSSDEPATGLSATLSSLLDGQGAVTSPHNFYPFGKKAVAGEPTLPDGSPGYGGSVLLDGDLVDVIVQPVDGPGCGVKAVTCTQTDGGYLEVGPYYSESANGPTSESGQDALFNKDGIGVSVDAAHGVLDNDALIALAESPVWHHVSY